MHKALMAAITLVTAPAMAQNTIPQRQLGPALYTTVEPLTLLLSAHRKSDGRLLVNEGPRHRLLMFDSTLSRATLIADSSGSTGLKYGPNISPTIPYLADSVLFVDGPARALIVLDPNGKQTR